MSIIDSSLAGLTLEDVLGNAKRSEPAPSQHDTVLDSRRDNDTSPKDKKSWKLFRDKLRLKRSGPAWTSSIPIPTSDVNIQANMTHKSHNSRRNHIDNGGEGVPDGKTKSLLARRSSVRFDHHDPVDATMPSDGPPSSSFHPQHAHSHSTGDDNDDNNSLTTTWRALSAREAVASQEAAEAAVKASTKHNASSEVDEPVTMSLMDLLGESGYAMGEDDDVYYNEDDDDEEEESMQEDGTEYTCCICKVNFTSSTIMPCGHQFCRFCSKEFSVERGNCSLCNGFVLEILEIF